MDINCDMGESFGAWTMGNDEALMAYVTSVNIACGFHAGDASVMRKTAELALKKGLRIGAHPGYPDLQGFGRRAMNLSATEVYDICVYQIGAMQATVRALGGTLHHVKPHGALYNTAAKDPKIANAIVRAVRAIDPQLVLYGLANSYLIAEAKAAEIAVAAEAFADRRYEADGSLTPRSRPDAVYATPAEVQQHVRQLIQQQSVTARTGEIIPLHADTICIHGDGTKALPFAQTVAKVIGLANEKL